MTRAPAARGGVAAALLTVIAGLLLFLLVDMVKERVAASLRFQVSPRQIDVEGDPGRLGGDFGRLIRGATILDRPRSIFDPELPAVVRANLERQAWVRRVKKMVRRFPNALSIHVELRRPLGVVRVASVPSERLAVDGEGVVVEEYTKLGPPHIPWIKTPGSRLTSVPTPGNRFKDGCAVQEAIGVIEEIDRVGGHPALDNHRIDEVKVGRRGKKRNVGDSDIRLVLDTGVEVLWGRSPRSAEGITEIPAETKLDHLARVQRRYPGLVGVELVDLRFERPEVKLASR
ncbi:MAG: hypothetical protein HRU14_07915 [Planctomycetes bacterium]|nr:hypothetical protein [Planctomycetota bacterium]